MFNSYSSAFLTALFFFFSISVVAGQQPATIDPALAPVIENFTGTITAITKQTDGKYLIGGYFTSVGGKGRFGLARINADGSLDEGFNPPISVFPTGVRAIVVQPDGKILVGGLFSTNSEPFRNILRLNPDGSEDISFTAITNSAVIAIAIQPDGKVLIGGSFTSVNNISRFGAARLNQNGSLDTTFTYSVRTVFSIAVQPDGNILLGGNFAFTSPYVVNRIVRVSSTGVLDSNFTSNASADNTVRTIKLQPDGKILLGGSFAFINGSFRNNLARLNADGTLDSLFNPSVTGFSTTSIESLDIDAAGKILIGGNFTGVNGSFRSNVAKINIDGTLDTNFSHQIGANLPVRVVLAEQDGNSLIGGDFQTFEGVAKYRIVKLNSNGSLNAVFNAAAYSNGVVYDVEIQPDGKILAAGSFYYVNGTGYGSVARFNPNGTLDSSFANFSQSQFFADPAEDIEIQPDGKIIVAGAINFSGNSTTYGIIRLNANGTLDNSFPPVNVSNVSVVKTLANGQILIGGGFTNVNGTARTRLALLNSNGVLDSNFNPNISATTPASILDIAVRSNGKIIIGGYFESVNGTAKTNLAQLNSDGTLDNTFSAIPSGTINSISQLPNESLLISGSFGVVNGVSSNKVARLLENGQVDNTFSAPSNLPIPSYIVKAVPDGRIILVGQGNYFNNLPNNVVVLNQNGSTNSILPNNSWFNGSVADVEVQNDGKFVFGGFFSQVGGTLRFGLARLNSLNLVRASFFDYDGDGKSDISVFRPSASAWFMNNSSNNSFSASQFGTPGDLLTPADFDGDGKTDVSVFRPSAGSFYRLNSSNNSFTALQFGTSDDLPVPADFDGDGKADVTVYRPSVGAWYRLNSSNGQFVSVQFGILEDKPAVGDFDGDGKADVSVFRPSNGGWYRLNSSNNQFVATQFGSSEDKVVPADYDGDGKTDIAVFRPSNGNWYRLNSSNGQFVAVQFGISEDKPVPADYDGDAKTDVAVFRPSDGGWYLLRSTQGFTGLQFGAGEDLPTPNAFVR